MPAAISDAPEAPILTDADFAFAFGFYGEDTTTASAFPAGSAFTFELAPLGRAHPSAGEIYTLTSQAGQVTLTDNIVTVQAPEATVSGWKPGNYRGELRRIDLSGAIEPLFVGEWPIVTGDDMLATAGGGGPLPGGSYSGVQILTAGDGSVSILRGEAAAEAVLAHADRIAADADLAAVQADQATVHNDRLVADNDLIANNADAAATHNDRLLADNDLIAVAADEAATHADKLAADTDASGAHADRLAADSDKAAADADAAATANDHIAADADKSAADADVITATAQAGIATTQAAAAAASATAAATSAAGANQNDTTGAAAILERAALNDPAASLAQTAASVNRGVEFRPAASSGLAYFRRGLLASSNLTAVATFTRATTATQTDQQGNVSAVASGAPRVSTAGYLSETAATNLVLWSQALDNAAWNKTTNGGAGVAPVVTADAGVAPDGTTTADRVQFSLAGGVTSADISRLRQVITTAAGTNSYSFWVRAFDGVSTYNMTAEDSSGPIQPVTVTGSWKRVTLTNVAGAGSTGYGLMLRGGQTPANSNAADVLIWGVQVEVGAAATSYVPTTSAAVTRNADVAQETVNIPVGQAFTVTGKAIAPPSTVAPKALFALKDAGGTVNAFYVYLSGSTVNWTGAIGGLGAGPASMTHTPGAPIGFAVSFSGDTITWSVNGAAAVSTTIPAGRITADLTALLLGCDYSGGGQLNSTLRELNIVMRAMSAAEVQTASDVSLERFHDFTTQTYQYIGETFGAITELPGTTFSRATVANVFSAGGFLLNIAGGALCVSDAGLTVQPSATNVVLWNRDLTNAAWAKTGATAAKDQTGIDGAANSASSILATAANATVLQAITLASGARFQTAYVKRITGSGVVNMTMDGGATWTAITLTTSWTRVSIPTQTLANPQVGFQIVTSGDKIAVDYVQNEAGTFATGVIATTSATATRNQDVLTTLDTAPAAFSVLAKVTIPLTGSATASPIWAWDDGTINNRVELYLDRSVTHLKAVVTVSGVGSVFDLGLVTLGNTYKVALAVAAGDFAASVNGAAVVTGAGFTMPPLTTFKYGADAGGLNFWGPGLLQIKRWRARRTNAQLVLDSTLP